MIHQFIFAAPRPGWGAERFQKYWLDEHAIRFACKIPQIRQYLVAPREDCPELPPVAPAFEGLAEIWIANPEEQIASLLSPEYLDGARLDEPNWAAFWLTFVHESRSEVLHASAPQDAGIFKISLFSKRPAGQGREAWNEGQRQLLRDRVEQLAELGLIHLLFAPARPELYGFGEPRFDALVQLGFHSRHAALPLLRSEAWSDLRDALGGDQLFSFAGRDHWIIRPGAR